MNKRIFSLVVIVAGIALVLAACGGQTTEAPVVVTDAPVVATEAPVALSGNPIRGGLLYDEWFKVLDVDAPEGDQPLWATQTTNTRSGKDSWRCKECHGWDYKGVEGAYGGGSHQTGFAGVLQVAGSDPNEILAALKTGDHDFSAYMDDQALTDIALFLSDYMLDSAAFITDKKPVGGNPENGKITFEGNCIDCHGSQGTSINFSANDSDPEYQGTIAIDNPWEFVHKARFGQPQVDEMPSLVDVGLADQDYIDLLAYIQTFPTSSPVVEGGRMYDNWIKATGAADMTENQSLWATQTANERTGNDTWRCKECHGWDYKGVEGRYGSGSHKTGFKGVFAAKDMTTEEIVAWLNGAKNTDHDFSAYLTADDMGRLAAFLQQEIIEKSFINDDKTVTGGDVERGKVLFSECAECHGEDGTNINFASGDEKEYVGTIAADNPWEFFNKATVGNPGAIMPAGWNLGFSLQDIIDLLTYAQTLPTK